MLGPALEDPRHRPDRGDKGKAAAILKTFVKESDVAGLRVDE
jgi:hypothetical protein